MVVVVVVVGIFSIPPPSAPLCPLVTSRPVVPLTDTSGLAQAHATSRADASRYLIGWRAQTCPHFRTETGGAVMKEGGEDNKVCDILDYLSESTDYPSVPFRFLKHVSTQQAASPWFYEIHYYYPCHWPVLSQSLSKQFFLVVFCFVFYNFKHNGYRV